MEGYFHPVVWDTGARFILQKLPGLLLIFTKNYMSLSVLRLHVKKLVFNSRIVILVAERSKNRETEKKEKEQAH